MLIIKLEYNAFSPEARTASDYGVPQKIIDYYDSKDPKKSQEIFSAFDNYEKLIYDRVKKIIEG